MKKIFFIGLALLSFCAAHAKEMNDTTVVFTVDSPLVCTNCEKTVTENLRFEKGIKNIKASHETNTVTITYDKRKTTCDKLRESFRKIGKEATLVPEK